MGVFSKYFFPFILKSSFLDYDIQLSCICSTWCSCWNRSYYLQISCPFSDCICCFPIYFCTSRKIMSSSCQISYTSQWVSNCCDYSCEISCSYCFSSICQIPHTQQNSYSWILQKFTHYFLSRWLYILIHCRCIVCSQIVIIQCTCIGSFSQTQSHMCRSDCCTTSPTFARRET